MHQHEETIYDLIPKETQEWTKPMRYKSKFQNSTQANIPSEMKIVKGEAKTMGPAKVETRGPNEFLKKHEKEPKLPAKDEQSRYEYSDGERKKPSVPRSDDKPVMGLKTTKNFITQNAVEAIMSVPGKPEKNFVDTKKGDKQFLETSGMEPKYIHKKEFGIVPGYLEKRKEEIEQAQQEYNSYIADQSRRGAMMQLPESERTIILQGLKNNWENLHHVYQGLSVVTDTAPKKNRKEKMESEMKQLERDIELLEKHSIIYIAH